MIGDIYRLSIVGQAGSGQTIVCTLHFKQLTAHTGQNGAHDLTQAFNAGPKPAFLGTCVYSNTLMLLAARGVTNITEGFDYALPAPQPTGSLVGDSLPPQTAPVITWLTGKVGRKYRGRMYGWPGRENDQNGGLIGQDWLDALDSFALAIRTVGGVGLGLAEFQHVVYSRTGLFSNPVTSHQVRNYLKTQRRRSLGTGS